jgi:ketosteroid isomerase-like protein
MHHRVTLALAASLALVAGCTATETTDPVPACDYDCTVDRHVSAIKTHDWDSFVSTITAQPDLQLILPDGTMIDGREAYLEILEPWLTGGGFTVSEEVIDQRIGADLGYTLLRMTQLNEGEEEPSRYFLLLVFALEDGEWRLVHDQNTAIPAAEQP